MFDHSPKTKETNEIDETNERTFGQQCHPKAISITVRANRNSARLGAAGIGWEIEAGKKVLPRKRGKSTVEKEGPIRLEGRRKIAR